MNFSLDPRLEEESILLAEWALSRVLLRDERRFAWIVLVPRRVSAVELFDLSAEDQIRLTQEINAASKALSDVTGALKINIGALGNIVRQLHVHIIARHEGDEAWPGPVWGHGVREPHKPQDLDVLKSQLQDRFDNDMSNVEIS